MYFHLNEIDLPLPAHLIKPATTVSVKTLKKIIVVPFRPGRGDFLHLPMAKILILGLKQFYTNSNV